MTERDKLIKEYDESKGHSVYSSESFPGSYDDLFVAWLIDTKLKSLEVDIERLTQEKENK